MKRACRSRRVEWHSESMNVVITGAAGRLGRETMRELLEAGHVVEGLDAVEASAPAPGPVRVCNLLESAALADQWRGVDAVVHLANHPTSYGCDARTVFNENVAMNFNVAESARLAGVPRLIFSSSVQVMRAERFAVDGSPSRLLRLPLDGDYPASPTNPYALSKVFGEDQLRYFAANHGMIAIALRFPALFHQVPVIAGSEPHPGTPLDEGMTWLTYADAARCIRQALVAPLTGYHCYFAASARPWLRVPVETIRQRYFPKVPVTGGAPLASLVDLRSLAAELDWAPQDD